MPHTPDRIAGTSLEEAIKFDGDQTSDPESAGELFYRADLGQFRLRDALGTFNPRPRAYYTAESLAESVTSSTTFQTKLQLDAANVVAGTFKLSWFYSWTYETRQNNFEAQIVQVPTLLFLHVSEPIDAAPTQNYPSAGFRILNLAAGNHTFLLQYRNAAAQQAINAYIRNAVLFLERLGE